jgi:hypothetical protein
MLPEFNTSYNTPLKAHFELPSYITRFKMSTPPLLAALAFIGPHSPPPLASPLLYIKTFNTGGSGADHVKMQMMIFSALDACMEKVGYYSRVPEGLLTTSPPLTSPALASPAMPQSTSSSRAGDSATSSTIPPVPGGGASFVGTGARGPVSADPFTGLLLACEGYKLFGYVSNTNIKIIAVLRDVLLREDRVREMFKALYSIFTEAVSSPLLSAPLSSPLLPNNGAAALGPSFNNVAASSATAAMSLPSIPASAVTPSHLLSSPLSSPLLSKKVTQALEFHVPTLEYTGPLPL